MRRCKHPEWVEVGRAYTTTRDNRRFRFENASEDLWQRLMFGITSIELRCAVCGDRKVVTAPGKVEP